MAHDRSAFPVQLEERRVQVQHAELVSALADFETAYALGLSKEAILTGRYHPAAAMVLGPSRLRALDSVLAGWRRRDPALWDLCNYIAIKPPETAVEEASCSTASTPTIEQPQLQLW